MGHGGCIGASPVLSWSCTRAWGRGSVWRWSVCFLYNQERSCQVRRFIFMWTFRRLPTRVTVRSNSSTSLLTAEGILAIPVGVWRHLHLTAHFLAVMMLMQWSWALSTCGLITGILSPGGVCPRLLPILKLGCGGFHHLHDGALGEQLFLISVKSDLWAFYGWGICVPLQMPMATSRPQIFSQAFF